jgi:hypothetical protein
MTTVMVLSGRERRRPWPAAEKLRIVEESLGCEAAFPGSRAGHDVQSNLLHPWRRQALVIEVVLRKGRVLRLPKVSPLRVQLSWRVRWKVTGEMIAFSGEYHIAPLHCRRGLGCGAGADRTACSSGPTHRRQRCRAGDRRHRDSQEGCAFCGCRCAVCFGAWPRPPIARRWFP